MVVIYRCEGLADKRAILKANKERTIVVQAVAHIYRVYHLVVKRWGQPSWCSTDSCRGNLTSVILPHLQEKELYVLSVLADIVPNQR